MKNILVFIPLLMFGLVLKAQVITPEVERRAESLLQQMTLEEKIKYISGYNDFYIRPVPRLGIPEIRLADGPQGIRNETQSTMFPAGILSASTWNRELVNRLGIALGQDARARGIHILLAPGVNIYRAPMNGRNFEYFGEDPYLVSEVACEYIKGVQSQRVVATIKHFAGNNQEWDRYNAGSDIDERTLHEIYFPAFEKAVKKANVGAVMNSYNLLNSVYASENKDLNIRVLRDDWGFKGILMSDWISVHSGVASANAGPDLEMPEGKYMNETVLLPAIRNGIVSEKTIDEKVRHILQVLIAYGFPDKEQKDASIPENNPYSNQVALELAREGLVLLKNENNILPLKGDVLVLGPNANKIPTGGGSGFVSPFSTVSVYEGLKAVSGKKNKVDVVPGIELQKNIAGSNEFFTDKGSQVKGLKAEYFGNITLSGEPVAQRIDTDIDFNWGKNNPFPGISYNDFSARWTGVFRAQQTGEIYVRLLGDDCYRMYFDNELVASDDALGSHVPTSKEFTWYVEKGKEYPVKIEYFNKDKDAQVNLSYAYLDEDALVKEIKKAKQIVLCIGFDSTTEGECFDRPFALPAPQEKLIDLVTAHHNNVIVVLNAGGGVDVSAWEHKVKAVLMAWYPGQEGGRAIAEVLTGAISPSGKLPVSIEKKWEDNPAYDSYYDNREDVSFKRVQYTEGVFVGYRGYDRSGVEPRYPFGFGLSYSTFEYSGLNLEKTGKNKLNISFAIKNTGKQDAAEIAQVYVQDTECSVPRPLKELKGYEKVFLKKGETKIITVELDERAFAFYDVNQQKFTVEPGEFKIMVGASSRDIRLEQSVDL